MIIDTSQGNVEVIGDVKKFKTSIDPKNLEFITTLLSSNLYSDPEQSFIREIVSNAWDSHVEAGTTDVPVIIRFKKGGYNDCSITIRDYGVGLSPERFQEVYCNIGSSTKRESNEFIGGFGIGKYSSLACSNTVYITSYYEGTAYYYVMVKSGNSITTNLLVEKPTTEKNGVEITIKSINDLKPFDKALQCIIFFPNVYVDGAESASKINGVKLKRFNNFVASSERIEHKLLLGNVLYPINKYHLSYEAQQFINNIDSTGIAIKFNVGEINITPNRENIIYSSDTIKKIEDKIKAAKIELDGIIASKLTKDYNDIKEYYNVMSKSVCYEPVSDSFTSYYGYRVEPRNMHKVPITYRGVELREYVSNIKTLLGLILPNFRGIVCDDKIYTKRTPYNVEKNGQVSTPKLLVLNAGARLIPVAKSYIRETYNGYGIMTDISKTEFSDWVKKECKQLSGDIGRIDLIIDGIYESMMKNAVRLDLNHDTAFLTYKSNIAANRPIDAKDIRESILYVWNKKGWKEKKTFKRFSHAVDYIKNLKKGVILANMDANEILFSALAGLKGFEFIRARKDIVADIRSMNLSCVVDTDWLLKKDPMLSIVAALMKYFPEGINYYHIVAIGRNIPESLNKEFTRLFKISQTFGSNSSYKAVVTRSAVKCDPYTEHLCLLLKKYIKKHTECAAIVGSQDDDKEILTTAVIIKTKAYRVSNEAYNRVKNNKLIRVLCRK